MDPFAIMQDNNLIGMFDIEARQFETIGRGIQESAESMFSLQERTNRFLGDRQWFAGEGVWKSKGGYLPSVWGHFLGFRRDFFDSTQYREFARRMAPYTYLYRVDEQGIIGAAWALLAERDRVWYLPEKGIQLGVYHHGWVDNREMLSDSESWDQYVVSTFFEWHTFREHNPDGFERLLSWERYLNVTGVAKGWNMCSNATTK